MILCIHCGREIVPVTGKGWADPDAPNDKDEDGGWLDDAVWRFSCDSNDTSFAAEHEPMLSMN